ncbi:hypothetical protein D6855_00850 [Butyrivibrio sp. CB08]|uniref:hypothetical protein n=1 Tax=Butyrivibrio sp. CB08 TaxID=2364879 RepID=UPI000EA9488A|nr:hypothetical protein [Butyrivibrio sp. CB08]RKM61997.1 hypothetical protein D6855_00850 [Butyrivibrio sp. CB08]
MSEKKFYTESQAQAIKKYLATKAEIRLRMEPIQKTRITQEAKNKGMSVNSYILDAVENQISLDQDGSNIEPRLIKNMINWLRSHSMSDSDIVDFLSYIARE